jgi:methionyl-tRNA formyltransferase
MRIVFMGSAMLSCPSLRALCLQPGFDVAAAVTQPPRPKGRSRRTGFCPAAEAAAQGGIALLTPENINAPESVAALRELAPDMIVVVAYGQILGRAILGMPPRGCVNVHASLLPRYRGAAPIQWAIANGEAQTGITTMMMNERMDDGDILLQESVDIGADETAGQLHDRLSEVGARLLIRTLAEMSDGSVKARPQDRALATFAPRLKKEDGRIIWTRPAADIYNRVRAFDPWPGSFCVVRGDDGVGRRLNVRSCRIEPGAGEPGLVLECGAEGPLVAAGGGAVRLLAVQPEGGLVMDGASFLCGHKLRMGEALG